MGPRCPPRARPGLGLLVLAMAAGAGLPFRPEGPRGGSCNLLEERNVVQKLHEDCFCYVQNRIMHLQYIWSTLQVKINSTKTFRFVPTPEKSNCQNSETVFEFAACAVQVFWRPETSTETLLKIKQYGEDFCFRIQPFKEELYTVSITREMLDGKLLFSFVAGIFLFYFANSLSRNTNFFYLSGIILGILALLVFILLALRRFIPRHSTFWVLLTGCWMSSLYLIYCCGDPRRMTHGRAGTIFLRCRCKDSERHQYDYAAEPTLLRRYQGHLVPPQTYSLIVAWSTVHYFSKFSDLNMLFCSHCYKDKHTQPPFPSQFSTIYCFKENMQWLWSEHRNYLLGYFVVVGATSFATCYQHGPLTSELSITLFTWTLQLTAFVFIYCGVTIPQVAYAVIAAMLCSKGLGYPHAAAWHLGRKIKNRFQSRNLTFRYLTEEEYREQGETETVRALEELRSLCENPDFSSWLAVSRLQSPHRFADFVLGSPHISPAEMEAHDKEYGIGSTFLEEQLFETGTASEQDETTSYIHKGDDENEDEIHEQVSFPYATELL